MRATPRASDDRLARNVWGRPGGACRMPYASRKQKVRNRRKRRTSMQWGPARAGAGLAHGAGGCKGGRKEVGERGRAPAHRRWRSGRERQRVRGGAERESARPQARKGERERRSSVIERVRERGKGVTGDHCTLDTSV